LLVVKRLARHRHVFLVTYKEVLEDNATLSYNTQHDPNMAIFKSFFSWNQICGNVQDTNESRLQRIQESVEKFIEQNPPASVSFFDNHFSVIGALLFAAVAVGLALLIMFATCPARDESMLKKVGYSTEDARKAFEEAKLPTNCTPLQEEYKILDQQIMNCAEDLCSSSRINAAVESCQNLSPQKGNSEEHQQHSVKKYDLLIQDAVESIQKKVGARANTCKNWVPLLHPGADILTINSILNESLSRLKELENKRTHCTQTNDNFWNLKRELEAKVQLLAQLQGSWVCTLFTK